MAEWRDITSYSQRDQQRIPQSWELDCGRIRLVVTRRHGLEGWYVSADGFFSYSALGSADIEHAKVEAMERLKGELTIALDSLESSNG